MKHYEKLVTKALEPAGGIWKEKVTSVMPIGDYDEETIKTGLLFWNRLLDSESFDPSINSGQVNSR